MKKTRFEKVAPAPTKTAKAYRIRRLMVMMDKLALAEVALVSCRRQFAICLKTYGKAANGLERERARFERINDPDLGQVSATQWHDVQGTAFAATLKEALATQRERLQAMRDEMTEAYSELRKTKVRKVRRYQ